MELIDSATELTKELIDSPMVLSEAFADMGGRVKAKGLHNIALWLKGLLNSSDMVRVRIKCYTKHDATDPYYTQVQVIGEDTIKLNEESYEISTAIINLIIPLGISTLAPYIQMEAKVDTAGATPAEIEEAYVTFDRRL